LTPADSPPSPDVVAFSDVKPCPDAESAAGAAPLSASGPTPGPDAPTGWATSLGLAAFLALSLPLAWLPRPLGLAVGACGGRLYFLANRRRREVAVDNLAQALAAGGLEPGLDPTATARRSFANLGRTAVESLRLIHRGLADFEGRWTVLGAEPIKAYLGGGQAAGRGLIIMTAHLGNWELAGQVVPRELGRPVEVVGRRQSAVAERVLVRLRTQGGNGYISKNGGARAMLQALRAGGILGILYDQAERVGPGGAPLSFMGRSALTTLGPLKLAARTGARLAPLFGRREGGRHVFEFGPLVEPPPRGDRGRLLEAAQRFNDLLAAEVRRRPDQWMWGHRRWKTCETRLAPDSP
jgi:KDO2-lipid IV(A) lauroyltransferase